MDASSSGDAHSKRLRKALAAMRKMRKRMDAMKRARREPIAVIGMGCRFPGGANSPDQYWDLLQRKGDAIQKVPGDRWDADALYDPDPDTPGKIHSKWGAFLDEVDQFDARFFNVPPREAEALDPQQRLLLEVSWEALERAGLVNDRLRGSNVGVFLGVNQNDYYTNQLHGSPSTAYDYYTAIGNSLSVAAGRLPFIFGWHGPTVSIDTACSSSLVATHMALQSLRSEECHTALACGVNVILAPEVSMMTSRMQALAPDGRCKAFDERANGYTRGEGCGVVVLKRLSDARADGDPIHAVIRGSAVNHDGASSGVTVPSAGAQQRLIERAVDQAGLTPSDVEYVEAHGTGTKLGDPIEIRGLDGALCSTRADDDPLVIGSVKTNFGHLEAAAGMAGLIKTVLAIQNETIPPQRYAETLNPHIEWDRMPIEVATEERPWRHRDARVAGVSSFGISGTNAHLLLSAPPTADADDASSSVDVPAERADATDDARRADRNNRPFLLPISARQPEALLERAEDYLDVLRDDSVDVRDVCHTAALRRSHHEHRLAVAGRTRDVLVERLEAYVQGEAEEGVVSDFRPSGQEAPLVFVFSGQGSQWAEMARVLLDTEPVFSDAIDRCDTALEPHLDWTVRDRLTGELPLDDDDITVIQPVQFAMHVGLAALWDTWGITPDAVVGHSMGEVAAAYVAGLLSLDAAAHVICTRSTHFGSLSGDGAMGLVGLDADTVSERIDAVEGVSIGAQNGPTTTVISGDADAVEVLLDAWEEDGAFCRLISTSGVAGHSPQVEPILDAVRDDLSDLTPNTSRIPFYSTVTGGVLPEGAMTGDYWSRNVRQSVRFWPTMEALLDDGFSTFLEVSPHPILEPTIERGVRDRSETVSLAHTLQREADERLSLATSLGKLYASGQDVDWMQYNPPGRHVALPVYPWQHERFWLDGVTNGAHVSATGQAAVHGGDVDPLLGSRIDIAHPDAESVWVQDVAANTLQGTAATRLATLCFAAAASAFDDACVGADVEFLAPVPSAAMRSLQVVVTDQTTRSLRIEVCSRPAESPDAPWTCHARARMRRMPSLPTMQRDERNTPEAIKERCPDTWVESTLIDRLADSPLQSRATAIHRQEGEALADLAPQETEAGGALPDALIESAATALYAAAPLHVRAQLTAGDLVPSHLGRLQVDADAVDAARDADASTHVHATVDAAADDVLVGRVRLLDASGVVLATLTDLTLEPQNALTPDEEPVRVDTAPDPAASDDVADADDARADDTPEARVSVLSRTGDARTERIATLLREQTARVLGLDPSEIRLDQPLVRLGMNSLMVFEVRNWIRVALGASVPMEKFAANFTIGEIVDEVDDQLAGTVLETDDEAGGRTSSSDPEASDEDAPASVEATSSDTSGASQPDAEREQATPSPLDAQPSGDGQRDSVDAAAVDVSGGEPDADGSAWTLCYRQRPDAQIRLFGFPHAGGGPTLFRDWAEHLPDAIECRAVQLPGRAERLREDPYTRLDALIDDLVDGLRPELDRPFAFFGHSLGGLVAFELTRRLRADDLPTPEHLFVSANRAPHLPDPNPPLHPLPDDDFLERLIEYGGIPEPLLGDQDMLDFFLPVLRADFTMLETYIHRSGDPLALPITALLGASDATTKPDAVQAWEAHTDATFAVHTFEGGHFYLQDDVEAVIDAVTGDLLEISDVSL